MITDKERREVANKLRERTKHKLAKGESMQHMFSETLGVYRTYDYGEFGLVKESETWKNIVNLLADLIDRPTCLDLVEHKQDPFIPGKRMVDGYFHCSDCGWDGQIWEHIGFGDMLAYEAVHCPKCGAIIERRA
jgi:hypothetical protein